MQDELTPPSPDRPLQPWLAALASAVIPGVGQLVTGRTRRGVALMTLTGLLILTSGWMTISQQVTLLKWSVQPEALRWLLAGNGLLLGLRVFAAADAFLGAAHMWASRTRLRNADDR